MAKRVGLFLPLLGLTAVVIVAGGLWIAGAAALDPAKLTAELQAAVHRATGRDLTIAGPVHLSLGLAPSFVVEGVSLANIPGGSRPQMLTAKSLRAEVALLPLLTGDAVVESLTIEQPDILLESTPDGVPNWQFVPVHRVLFQAQPGEPSGGGGTHIEIHRMRIQGGQLTWQIQPGQIQPGQSQPGQSQPGQSQPGQSQPGAKLVLAIDSLTASTENPATPLRIDVKASHDGAPLTITASTGSIDRLQGGPVSAMAGAWPVSVQIDAAGARVKLDGGVAHPDQARGYNFLLTGTVPDLAAIAPYFPGTSLPPLKDVTFSTRLSDGASGDLRTAQLSLHAGAADLGSWAAGLSINQMALSAPGPGQNAQLNVDGFYADAPLHLAGTALQPDVVAQNSPIPVTLSGQAGTADFTAKGTMPPGLNASGLDLTVSAHAPDLSELSALFGRTLPPAHDLQFDTHVEDAGFKLRGVTLRNLTLSSSVAQISGTASLLWSPRPALNGTLQAGHIDLDALFPDFSFANAIWAPAAADAAPPAALPTPVPAPAVPIDPALPGPAIRVISNRPLNFAPLTRADADLALTAVSVTAGGETFHDVSGHLTLAGGKAAFNPFRFSAKSGVLIGGASIDASVDQPPVALALRASAFPSGMLAGLAGAPDGASGPIQLDLQLSGTGQTPQALAATLDGHVGLSMVGGMLDGALLQSLIGDTLAAAGVPTAAVGNTPVRCLALRADFAHGAATIHALSLDTPHLALDGTGGADLAGETLDLHLKPSLRSGPIAASAPVALSGPFSAPKATLDPVLSGGRVGFSLGGADEMPSDCGAKLAIARGGAPGPMPVQAAQPDTPSFVIKKPKDLLQGLFH